MKEVIKEGCEKRQRERLGVLILSKSVILVYLSNSFLTYHVPLICVFLDR